MATTIPNENLIRHLIETYYGQGDKSGAEDGYVSSHWRHFSKLFNVKLDAAGNLVSLSGIGFGSGNWSHLPHRGLDQLCILTHLIHLPHRWKILRRLLGTASNICKAMGLDPTIDVFRQVCSLELLLRHIPGSMRSGRIRFLMIGDGFGILSAMLKSVFPNSTIILVDIGKTLLFQAYYCQKAHPECRHEFVKAVTDPEATDFVYCPTELLEELDGFTFDIATNIVSMQEMNVATIERYFSFLRDHLQPDNLFYCCNRESKTLFDGEVAEFGNYPWQESDKNVMDDSCPWNLYFFLWGRAVNGPRLFGLRLPLASFYDGKVLHRLAVLATNTQETPGTTSKTTTEQGAES